jgi:alpha-L-fucosidase 2
VKKGLPPFLILHGDKDKTVPFQQTLNFMEKLHAAGVPCDLITIPGAPHSLLAWDKLYPDYKAQLIAWLNRTLDASLVPGKATGVSPRRATSELISVQ